MFWPAEDRRDKFPYRFEVSALLQLAEFAGFPVGCSPSRPKSHGREIRWFSSFDIPPKRLIAEIASGFGPAHYSSDISNALLEMTTVSIGGVPSYFRTLLRFAEIILELGKKFLTTH